MSELAIGDVQINDGIEIERLWCGCINMNGQGHLPYMGQPCHNSRPMVARQPPPMADRRTRRLRTRAAIERQAMEDQE